MDKILVPGEQEIKGWVKEAVKECLRESGMMDHLEKDEPLLSRQAILVILDNISLNTLKSWMRKGMPYYKQQGRVYFLRSEVMAYIKEKRVGPYKPGRRFSDKGKLA